MRRRPHTLAIGIALAAALGAAPAGASAAGRRVLVLPFEVRAAVPPAVGARVAEALSLAVAAVGYETVTGDDVSAFLRSRRIRYLDSLAPAEQLEVVKTFGVDAVLAGTVLAWDPRTAARDPLVSVRTTLVAPGGELLWTNVTTLTGAGQEGAFGRGRVEAIDALVRLAVRDIAQAFPPELARVRIDHAASRWKRPRVFRDRTFLQGERRIAILPLDNATPDPVAARVLDAVLRHRFGERRGVEVVPAGELRGAIVEKILQPPANMPLSQLRQLGQALNVHHFLAGAIFEYGTGTRGAVVELSLSLVDVDTGAVVWSALHRRTARDYDRPFAGREPELVEVADRMVAELADAFTH